jgi:hypothetical protein
MLNAVPIMQLSCSKYEKRVSLAVPACVASRLEQLKTHYSNARFR